MKGFVDAFTKEYGHAPNVFAALGYDAGKMLVDAIKRELKRPDLAVKFVPVTSVTRYPMLIDGQIDLECANTPSTADTSTTMTPTVAPIPPS